MKFTLKINSTNQKTGGIPVSTSPHKTCPSSCPFLNNGCYAIEGPLRFHWEKVSSGERGVPWSEFCVLVSKLPEGQLWRHNQAGDLPSSDFLGVSLIDREMISLLILANKGRRGFTYTHKTEMNGDLGTIEMCNQEGFTVNMSANNIEHADHLYSIKRGPVSVVLPSWEVRKEIKTPDGNFVKMCPAIYSDKKCINCGLCQISKRDFIIGVPAHGSGVVKVDKIVESKRLRKLF